MSDIILCIPGFAVAYHSHLKLDNQVIGEWRLSPLIVQAAELPLELQTQIIEWLKEYDVKRRKLDSNTIQYELGI